MRFKQTYWYLAVTFAALVLIYIFQPRIETGKDVIAKMKDSKDGELFELLSFHQKSQALKNDSVLSTQIWIEYYKQPGHLLIKYDSLDSEAGMIFRKDSMYRFSYGMLRGQTYRPHELLILGFDVYHQPIEKTMKQLKALNYNIDIVKDTAMMNLHGYLIGDPDSKAFFIDKERWLFRKSYMITSGDTVSTTFSNYEETVKGPLATHVTFYRNQRKVFQEIYYNITFPEELPDALFSPENFTATGKILENQ